jgi:hypothetical protein
MFKAFKSFKPLKPPLFILPRGAGEDRGRGLNGAQRLNGLNIWNRPFSPSAASVVFADTSR